MPSGRPKGLVGKKYDYLEADEVKRFFEAIPADRTDHHLLFRLQSNCGLRISEVVGELKKYKDKAGVEHVTNIPPLRRSDVVLARWVLKIQGKGNKRRDVTFEHEPTVEDALRRHFEAVNPQDIVLLNRDGRRAGKQITPHQAWRLMKKYCLKAGIARPWSGPGSASPHLLRHTCATHMLMNGRDISWVQRQLGHDRIETTQIYRNLAAVANARAGDGVQTLPY